MRMKSAEAISFISVTINNNKIKTGNTEQQFHVRAKTTTMCKKANGMQVPSMVYGSFVLLTMIQKTINTLGTIDRCK